MQNILESHGEIKAVLASEMTDGAKLIAIAQIVSNARTAAELSALCHKPIRTIERHYADLRRIRRIADTQKCGGYAELRTETTQNCVVIPLARVLDNNLLPNLEDSSEILKNPLPPTKTKSETEIGNPKTEFGLSEARKAFEAYNETALRCALPQAAKLTPDRQRKIIARLKDYGLDGWTKALANIEKSAFLTAGTDVGFRADLDFMCQAKSFGKLHDGGYGNGRHAKPPGSRMMEILNRKSAEART